MCGRLLRVVRRTSQLGRIVRHAGHTQGMRTRPSARRMMAIFVHNDDATRRHPHARPIYPRARGGWRSRAAATQKRTSDTAIHRPRMRHMYHGTLAPLGSAARFCRFGLIGRRHGRRLRGARSPLPSGPTFPCPSATWGKHRMRVPPIADHRPPPPPPATARDEMGSDAHISSPRRGCVVVPLGGSFVCRSLSSRRDITTTESATPVRSGR
jgi:hypothetical protein